MEEDSPLRSELPSQHPTIVEAAEEWKPITNKRLQHPNPKEHNPATPMMAPKSSLYKPLSDQRPWQHGTSPNRNTKKYMLPKASSHVTPAARCIAPSPAMRPPPPPFLQTQPSKLHNLFPVSVSRKTTHPPTVKPIDQPAGPRPRPIEIEIELVHSEPANWTGNHQSGLYTKPYKTYEQVYPGFSLTRYTYRHT
jgi:hypothetical protein